MSLALSEAKLNEIYDQYCTGQRYYHTFEHVRKLFEYAGYSDFSVFT